MAQVEGGAGRWLLVRRNPEDSAKLAYYLLAYEFKETPVEEVGAGRGQEMAIEGCFEQDWDYLTPVDTL